MEGGVREVPSCGKQGATTKQEEDGCPINNAGILTLE